MQILGNLPVQLWVGGGINWKVKIFTHGPQKLIQFGIKLGTICAKRHVDVNCCSPPWLCLRPLRLRLTCLPICKIYNCCYRGGVRKHQSVIPSIHTAMCPTIHKIDDQRVVAFASLATCLATKRCRVLRKNPTMSMTQFIMAWLLLPGHTRKGSPFLKCVGSTWALPK